jgi:hypothetical protein
MNFPNLFFTVFHSLLGLMLHVCSAAHSAAVPVRCYVASPCISLNTYHAENISAAVSFLS